MSLSTSVLTTKQLAAIGVVATASADLEGTINLILCFLTKLRTEEYDILTSGKTIGPKLDLLKTIGSKRLKASETRGAFESLMDSLSCLISERNTVIHGTWQPKGGFTIAFFAGLHKPDDVEAILKGRRGNHRKINVDQLAKLGERISQAHSELFAFFKEHWIDPAVRKSIRRDKFRKFITASLRAARKQPSG